MSGFADLRSILFDTKREIEQGIANLTEEETDTVRALQDVFPQYPRLILMTVVYIHSHHFGSSQENLEAVCLNFLLGEDWENLADVFFLWIPDESQEDISANNDQVATCGTSSGRRAELEAMIYPAEAEISHSISSRLEAGQATVVNPTKMTALPSTSRWGLSSSTALPSTSSWGLSSSSIPASSEDRLSSQVAAFPSAAESSAASASSSNHALSAPSVTQSSWETQGQASVTSLGMSFNMRRELEGVPFNADVETVHSDASSSLEYGLSTGVDPIPTVSTAWLPTSAGSSDCGSSTIPTSTEDRFESQESSAVCYFSVSDEVPSASLGATPSCATVTQEENTWTEGSVIGSDGIGEDTAVPGTSKENISEQPVIAPEHAVSLNDDNTDDESDNVALQGGEEGHDKKQYRFKVHDSLKNRTIIDYDDSSHDSLPDVCFNFGKSESSKSVQPCTEHLPQSFGSSAVKKEQGKDKMRVLGAVGFDKTKPPSTNSILSGQGDMHDTPTLKPRKSESSRLSETICEFEQERGHSSGASGSGFCAMIGSQISDILSTSVKYLQKNKRHHKTSASDHSLAESRPVPDCEDLPLLSPRKRKGKSIPKSDEPLLAPGLVYLSGSEPSSRTSSGSGGITYLGTQSFSGTTDKARRSVPKTPTPTPSTSASGTSSSDLTHSDKASPKRAKSESHFKKTPSTSASGMKDSELRSYSRPANSSDNGNSHCFEESANVSVTLKRNFSAPTKTRTSKPSASATSGPPVLDTRSDLRRRVDSLNARVMDLITDVELMIDKGDHSSNENVHSVKFQATLSSSSDANTVTTQMVTKHQSAPHINPSTMVVPSTSKTTVTCSTRGMRPPMPISLSLSDAERREDLKKIQQPAATVTTNQALDLTQKDKRVKDQPDQTHNALITNDVSCSHPENNPGFTEYREEVEILLQLPDLIQEREDDDEEQELLSEQPRLAAYVQHAVNLQEQPRPLLEQQRLFAEQSTSVLLSTKPLLTPPKLKVQQGPHSVLQPSKLGVVRPQASVPVQQQQQQQQQPQGRVSFQQQVYLPRCDYAQGGEDQPGPSGLQWAPQPLGVERVDPWQGMPIAPIILDDSLDEPMLVDDYPILIDGRRQPGEDPVWQHPGLDMGVKTVLEVFPAAGRGYVTQLLKEYLAQGTIDEAMNLTMDRLLQDPPVVAEANGHEVTVVHVENGAAKESRDYYKQYSDRSPYSSNLAADRLSMEFRNVRMDTINEVLKRYNGHYAPAYRCLSRAIEDLIAKHDGLPHSRKSFSNCLIILKINEGEKKDTINAPLMKTVRGFCQRKLDVKDLGLKAEIEFVEQRKKQDKEEIDHKMAWSLLESEYEEQGQSIECGCCFLEHPFENLVQCFEGHLFCCQCLLGYAREAIFGSGKLNLNCMTECGSKFPKSQLEKALPVDMMKKYEERMTEEDLNKAAMEDLVRCPSCNMAVVVDSHIQHFQCPNSTCRKEMCRRCKEDWSDHKGKTCEEVEKKDETRLRTSYEEKMTTARVRRCPSCQAQFFKEEGCNKMTCRCGDTMCYICRTPHINYNHFCRHPRDPGKDCTTCVNCSLWTNPEEDETRAITEIQKEAQEKRKAEGYLDEKLIGAPDEPAVKKRKSH